MKVYVPVIADGGMSVLSLMRTKAFPRVVVAANNTVMNSRLDLRKIALKKWLLWDFSRVWTMVTNYRKVTLEKGTILSVRLIVLCWVGPLTYDVGSVVRLGMESRSSRTIVFSATLKKTLVSVVEAGCWTLSVT